MKTPFTFFCFALVLCISTTINIKAQVNKRDSLALVDLYNSTNGASWHYHNNWLSGPVKSWYGITLTDGNKRVSAIVLSGNNLTGALPLSLQNLSKLNWLHLFSNHLSGPIPPELGNLSGLTSLHLEENLLSGSIPPQLGDLSSLISLHLEVNQLSGNIPPELGKLSNLTNLSLRQNQLSGNIPPELGNLSNLRSLNLNVNQLSGTIPPELGQLSNLGELLIFHNKLNGKIPPELGDLLKLAYLDLSANQLSGRIPPELCNLTNLYSLQLSDNKLGGFIPGKIGKLRTLKYLSLNQNQFSGTIPSSITKLTVLETLNLSANRFTFDGMELVAQTFPFAKYVNQALIPVHLNKKALSVSAGGSLNNNIYSWRKARGSIVAIIEGDSVFHPTESGIYYVRVSNKIANGATLTSDTITYSAPALSDAFSSNSKLALPKNGFSVYPNPAKDILHIQANGNASFSLLNQSGEILLTTIINTTGNINILKLSAGEYYLRNNSTNTAEKIFVVR